MDKKEFREILRSELIFKGSLGIELEKKKKVDGGYVDLFFAIFLFICEMFLF